MAPKSHRVGYFSNRREEMMAMNQIYNNTDISEELNTTK